MNEHNSLLQARVRESDEKTGMRHIMGFTPDRRLCGAKRDPSKPVTYGPSECVVCVSVRAAMSPGELNALRAVWARYV